MKKEIKYQVKIESEDYENNLMHNVYFEGEKIPHVVCSKVTNGVGVADAIGVGTMVELLVYVNHEGWLDAMDGGMVAKKVEWYTEGEIELPSGALLEDYKVIEFLPERSRDMTPSLRIEFAAELAYH